MVLDKQVIKDLELESLIHFMIPEQIMTKLQSEAIRKVLLSPSKERSTIKYRIEISSDLFYNQCLFEAFKRLLPVIETLTHYRASRYRTQSPLYALTARIGELECYTACVDTLKGVFEKMDTGKMAEGFKKMYGHIREIYNNENFLHMRSNLPELSKRICEPIQKALNRYIRINTDYFTAIQDELIFYPSGVDFLLKLKEKGRPVCQPEILLTDDRITEIDENYNINLFIQMYKKGKNLKELVTNRVNLGPEGRIQIVTGPNHGGKTVYTQGIGLFQILFQSGLCIPGRRARMSPVDNIFTHFQIEEQIAKELGPFADEAHRLHLCVKKATPRSLLLMNESFTSTNYTESLFIARDIMKVFRMLGIRCIFATHFHDLAMAVEEINQCCPGESRLISMISVIEEEKKRTYRIIPGPPTGKSYAREIANRYGIGLEQLLKIIGKAALTA